MKHEKLAVLLVDAAGLSRDNPEAKRTINWWVLRFVRRGGGEGGAKGRLGFRGGASGTSSSVDSTKLHPASRI